MSMQAYKYASKHTTNNAHAAQKHAATSANVDRVLGGADLLAQGLEGRHAAQGQIPPLLLVRVQQAQLQPGFVHTLHGLLALEVPDAASGHRRARGISQSVTAQGERASGQDTLC